MKKIITLALATFLTFTVIAQDIHFSQFYAAPTLLNPAAVGDFNSDHRLFLNYKDQWRAITTPYQTYAMSYDNRLGVKRTKNDHWSFGITAYSDKAGDTKMGMTNVNLGIGYHKELIPSHKFSFGFQGGFRQHSINFNDAQWGSQYNGTSFDPTMSNNELFYNQTFIVPDFNAGTQWTFTPHRGFQANAGIAVHHLGKPLANFMEMKDSDNRQYRKVVGHASTEIEVNNTNVTYIPRVLISIQGPSQEIIAGSMIRYELSNGSKYTMWKKESAIHFGAFYRVGDAIILASYYEWESVGLGISYDVNFSSLTSVSNGRGGLEFTLRYITPFVSKHYGKKPRF